MAERRKVAVHCPDDAALVEKLLDAAAAAGGGKFDHYSRVAMVLRGNETWKTEAGANPHIGEVGKISEEPSVRIEMQCDAADVRAVIAALRSVHPYEQPLIEVIRLEEIE
jgi:hypothetical protein